MFGKPIQTLTILITWANQRLPWDSRGYPKSHSDSKWKSDIADPRILSWWTETDLRTDSLHQSDAPQGLTWCFWLLTCAHAAWKSTSAALLFCTSGEETVENLKISRGQLAPCQEKRIKRQK